MKRIIAIIFVLALASVGAFAQQEKGVDSQNERVRDSGNNRTPADNGTKQDNGAGRGIDFGKGRTPTPPPVPNPYRFSARRDAVIKAIEDAMDEVFQKVKGTPIPEVGKEDRQLLYVAISRGVLKYLADHQETMSVFAIDEVNDTGHIDLNVTMNAHQTHV